MDGFLLSPPFSPDIKSYVVWLPYETESVEISGAAADAKATVQTNGGETLLAGQDNPVTVTCTAENGDKQEYLVIVKRAAAHDGSVESLPEESSEAPSQTESSEPVSSEEEIISEIVEASSGSPLWLTIMLCFVCLAVGFGVAVVIQRNHPNFLSSKKRGFKR